jgi:hypothetical protein
MTGWVDVTGAADEEAVLDALELAYRIQEIERRIEAKKKQINDNLHSWFFPASPGYLRQLKAEQSQLEQQLSDLRQEFADNGYDKFRWSGAAGDDLSNKISGVGLQGAKDTLAASGASDGLQEPPFSDPLNTALLVGGIVAGGIRAAGGRLLLRRLLSRLRTPRPRRRFRWNGASIKSGVKQTRLRDIEAVNQIKNDMLNGTYRFTDPEGRISGWRDAAGNYYIGEGHHRMEAALQIFEETGDPKYVNQLLENGHWSAEPPPVSDIVPLPRRL